jgi:quercetin dioxygenase-like cupin family protein
MRRLMLIMATSAVITASGLALAQRDAHSQGNERVKVLSAVEIAEKVDGKLAKATTVQVTLQPGQAGEPHRHPGPVFGYVIEGEYEWAIDDAPAKVLKAGETFYEPTGCLHRVSKNPAKRGNTRVLAVVVSPRDAKELVIPEKQNKK